LKIWLILIISQIFFGTFALATPTINITAKILEKKGRLEILGEVLIQNWAPHSGKRCLFTKYNDSNIGWDYGDQLRLDKMSGGRSQIKYAMARTEMLPLDKTKINPLYENIIHEVNATGDVHISFASVVPQLLTKTSDDWLIEGFYPQILADCPDSHAKNLLYPKPTAHINAKIQHAKNLIIAAPNSREISGGTQSTLLAKAFAFAFSPTYKSVKFEVNGIPVSLFYHSDSFLDLKPTMEKALLVSMDWLGTLPTKALVFVETSALSKNNLPGIIPVNRPRQTIFNKAQSSKGFLNWTHWVVINQIYEQYFGVYLETLTVDDYWLQDGIQDYLVYQTLLKMPERLDLFSNDSILSIDFLTAQEYSAAINNDKHPFTIMLQKDMRSIPYAIQSTSGSSRMFFGLRRLELQMGLAQTKAFFQSYGTRDITGTISPKNFLSNLSTFEAQNPANKGQVITLKKWLSSNEWDDFEISDFSSAQNTAGKWQSQILIRQLSGLPFVPKVAFYDANSAVYSPRITMNTDGTLSGSFVSDVEMTEAKIDPGHEFFDKNRFNNKTSFSGLSFFPGSAKNISDEELTLLWLPYPQRRPGEPWSLAIQGALFKYINSGLFFTLEYAPKPSLFSQSNHDNSDQFSGTVRYRYGFPTYALHGDLQTTQTYDNDRISQLTLVRAPLFSGNPRIALNSAVRYKERLHAENSEHATYLFGAGIRPISSRGFCNYNASSEYEQTFKAQNADFDYTRSTTRAIADCGAGNWGLGLSGFYGTLAYEGEPPETAFFKPTKLSEASLNIIQANTVWPKEILSMTTGITFPLQIPLPDDTLVLSNRIKGNAFYQAAKSIEPNLIYRTAGIGLQLPIGGDLSGKGSLSFTTIQAYVVLYSKVGSDKSTKPSPFISINGDL